jgi:hypothetical protein
MIQLVGGIAAGAAAMMLAPSIMSAIAPVVKPVIKTLIKGGLLAFESGKEAAKEAVHEAEVAIASSVEAIEDLTAEAKAEIEESQKMPVLPKTSKKKAAQKLTSRDRK